MLLPLVSRGLGISHRHELVSHELTVQRYDDRKPWVPRYTVKPKWSVINIINILLNKQEMKFSFSGKFRQSHYQALLREVGEETEFLRLWSRCRVKEMMADLHVSHQVLKKC